MEFRLTLLNLHSAHENSIVKLRREIDLERLRIEKQDEIEKLEIQNMINENHGIYQEIQTIKDKISTLDTKKDNLSNSYNNLLQMISKNISLNFPASNTQEDPILIDSQGDLDVPFKQPNLVKLIELAPIETPQPLAKVDTIDPKKKFVKDHSIPKLGKFPAPTTAFVDTSERKRDAREDFDYVYERKVDQSTSKKRKSPSKTISIPSPKKEKKSDKVAPPVKLVTVLSKPVNTIPFSLDLANLSDSTQLDKSTQLEKSSGEPLRATLEIKPMYVVKKEMEDKKKQETLISEQKKQECHECRRFYEATISDPVERQRMIDKTSRHACKHKSDTPQDFWCLGGFVDTQADEDEDSLTY